MKKIIFATTNQGKVREVKMMMEDFGVDFVTMKDAGIDIDIVEDGKTFEKNAIIKAKTIMEATGEIALADDSGLEVLALEGAPGVRSARYASEEATDEENNKLLLQTMKFQVKRTCRFRCALAVAAPNGKILLESDGICDGMLLHEPLGTEGFGYDPLFWSTELHKGMGEATMQEKNKISHRGKAIKKLVANWGKMK